MSELVSILYPSFRLKLTILKKIATKTFLNLVNIFIMLFLTCDKLIN